VSLKYAIHSKPAPPRFRPVGKLGIVDWREDCSNCHNCVKRSCVYGLYRDEYDALREEVGYLDYIFQCKGCLNCVQNCTKNLLTRVTNPEYRRLGDRYYTADILQTTWFQADTGRIPVSGAGYGGPFSGQGFDSMWTDMSEIVRPTRDGIHGREYISTGVDIGRKLANLAFDDGQLTVDPPPLVESPLPVLFDCLPAHWRRGPLPLAAARAAAAIGSFAVMETREIPPGAAIEPDHLIPLLAPGESALEGPAAAAPIVMVPDSPDVMALQASLKADREDRIVAIRLPADATVASRAVQRTLEGAEVLHLVFDAHGRSRESASPRHVRDVLREVHTSLVKAGCRDLVTVVATGGIALAEHVAKAIICGADLVAIDLPQVIALECRLCGECERGEPCQIEFDAIEIDYAVHRLVNLMSAWHQQLIEVLGAMGIREVRRLRGETGRAMFFEDLEQEAFGRLFGKRKQKP